MANVLHPLHNRNQLLVDVPEIITMTINTGHSLMHLIVGSVMQGTLQQFVRNGS